MTNRWTPAEVMIRDHTGRTVAVRHITCYDGRGWTRHDQPGVSAVRDLIPDGGEVVWSTNGAPVRVSCSRCTGIADMALMSPGMVCHRDHAAPGIKLR